MSGKQLKKNELVDAVANASGLDKKSAGAAIDGLCETIIGEAKAGNAIVLPGVGKIATKDRPARTVRNPSTGETSQKAADRAVRFTAAKAIKDAIN